MYCTDHIFWETGHIMTLWSVYFGNEVCIQTLRSTCFWNEVDVWNLWSIQFLKWQYTHCMVHRSEGFPNGIYLVPGRHGPGLLPDWESCWVSVAVAAWSFYPWVRKNCGLCGFLTRWGLPEVHCRFSLASYSSWSRRLKVEVVAVGETGPKSTPEHDFRLLWRTSHLF